MDNYREPTWRTFEHDNYIGIWPNEGVGNSGGYAPMAKVAGDKRWVTDEKRKEIAELMASAPDLKKENERLREDNIAFWKEMELMREDLKYYSEEIERLQKTLQEIADAKISGVIDDGYNLRDWLIKHHTILVNKARAALKEGE